MKLSTQQRRVLELAAKGLRDKQIARELELSLGTVKTHMRFAMQKLGAANRVAAAVAFIRGEHA